MMIDSHCHFDDTSFDPDRDQAWQRAEAVGVTALVLPAVSAANWPRIQATAQDYRHAYASFGLHPVFQAEHRPAHLGELERWLADYPAVAVGECGLDYFVEGLDSGEQESYFSAQLAIARGADLPVIIHARRAVDPVLKQLRRFPGLRGVVHSFSGSEQQAQQLIDLGFYLSFGHPVTYSRAKRLHRLVAQLPLQRMMLETDAPDQPGAAHRGERNEPAYLPEVLQCVARLREESESEIAAVTARNAIELFRLTREERAGAQ